MKRDKSGEGSNQPIAIKEMSESLNSLLTPYDTENHLKKLPLNQKILLTFTVLLATSQQSYCGLTFKNVWKCFQKYGKIVPILTDHFRSEREYRSCMLDLGSSGFLYFPHLPSIKKVGQYIQVHNITAESLRETFSQEPIVREVFNSLTKKKV
jgi:hypothetical protein